MVQTNRRRDDILVSPHAKIDDMEAITTHHIKLDRGHPSLFIRYGRHQWVAKVGTRRQIVENEEALHRLEKMYRQQTQ